LSEKRGIPQGSLIAPVLSNIYFHFVQGLWFEKKIKPTCRGKACPVHFGDNFVANFQFRQDADHFHGEVRSRFAELGLGLAKEKTQRIFFWTHWSHYKTAAWHGKTKDVRVSGFKHLSGIDR
jgi:hypothetical protein